jgi:hypothetical protein
MCRGGSAVPGDASSACLARRARQAERKPPPPAPATNRARAPATESGHSRRASMSTRSTTDVVRVSKLRPDCLSHRRRFGLNSVATSRSRGVSQVMAAPPSHRLPAVPARLATAGPAAACRRRTAPRRRRRTGRGWPPRHGRRLQAGRTGRRPGPAASDGQARRAGQRSLRCSWPRGRPPGHRRRPRSGIPPRTWSCRPRRGHTPAGRRTRDRPARPGTRPGGRQAGPLDGRPEVPTTDLTGAKHAHLETESSRGRDRGQAGRRGSHRPGASSSRA